MSTPTINGKEIINTLYHGAVVSGLAIGIAMLTKSLFKVSVPKMALDGSDCAMVVLDISAALALRDVLVRMGFPDNILN